MTPDAIDRAARIIAAARRERRLLPGLPDDCRPRSVEEAYAVQDRLIVLLDESLGGWFLGCTNRAVQRQLGLDGPYWGRLLASALRPSPADFGAEDFLSIALEAEFAFRLGRDLPPRATPYTEAEVAAAVETLHPAIEVVNGHFEDWLNQDIALLIADNGTDGALVYGAGVADWHELDLPGLRVRLDVNGETVREGSGGDVLGSPLAALAWLANARSARGEGLRAGHMHNTGTCTTPCFVRPGDSALADFGPLGIVRVRFAS